MEEIFDYIAIACSRAWNKSWSKLGLGINIIMSAIAVFIYTLLEWPAFDIIRGLIIVIVVFIFIFGIFCTWELRGTFPNITLEKRNEWQGAYIVIYNNDVLDLSELRVEVTQKIWVSREGKVRIPVDPSNRSFNLGDETKVHYGGGTKKVLIASGEGCNATFHTRILEPDTGYEYYDGADHSVYDITIEVKGTIDGHPIHPKKLTGRLKYIRAEQEFNLQLSGKMQTEHTLLSKMEWENLNK